MKKITVAFLIFFASIQIGSAQNEGEGLFQDGLVAFEKGYFREALDLFDQAADTIPDAYYFLASMHFHGLGTGVDKQEAFDLAETGYEKGSVPSTYLLGKLYFFGQGIKEPKEETGSELLDVSQLRWFKEQFEETGNPMYALSLGHIYSYGFCGVEEDDEAGLTWYKKSAEKDFPLGHFYWGNYYYFGSKDYEKALPLYNKAAEMGYSAAQNNLGAMYANGEAVEENLERAVFWYKKAADQNYSTSHKNLGFLYNEGTGVPVDWNKAAEHFAKAAAAGSTSGKRELGEFYLFGVGGVPKNVEKARELFQEAKESGDKRSANYIQVLEDIEKGVSYEVKSSGTGNKIFVSDLEMKRQKAIMPYRNPKSFSWYTKVDYQLGEGVAVRIFPTRMDEETDDFWYTNYSPSKAFMEQKGSHNSGVSILNEPGGYRGIAYLYYDGHFFDRTGQVYEKVTIKVPVALCALPTNELFENVLSSAENGSPAEQYKLGMKYFKGHDTQKDHDKAFEWIRKAAKQEYAPAQRKLGEMYFSGQGVKKDENTGLDWVQKAALKGDKIAQSLLSRHFYFVEQDFTKAAKFAQLASKQKDDWGQTIMGALYHYGHGGIEQDDEKALTFYTNAIEQGNKYARLLYDNLSTWLMEEKKTQSERERQLQMMEMMVKGFEMNDGTE